MNFKEPNSVSNSDGARLFPFLTILFQLGLFLIIVHQYELERRAFVHLGIVAFFGFAIHYFLPRPWRRPFFAMLSLFCLAFIFGFQLEQWSVVGLVQAAWIAGLGLGLIGICHLPIRIAWRTALLLAVLSVMSLMRAQILPAPWSPAVWPVLSAMFMFRTAIYLHTLKYDKQPGSLTDAICYFFMLPNPYYPLLPVVDFLTLRRTYYDAQDRHQIYQTGITWLYRGALHLVLYRAVYHYLVIDASQVTTVLKLFQYLLWPFLLYLRVSGQFHIIVGFLHLFGFNLPETHRLYFLSSSFTDFWRRINIYWKDFMMKLAFYPAYFQLKRWGPTSALVISTLIVFLITWLLHSYQSFWITGTWLLSWNDSLFWAILAVLVVANALFENAYGRVRTLSHTSSTKWSVAAATALRTIGVFAAITVLWSFWTTPSTEQWVSAFRVLRTSHSMDIARSLLLALTGLILLIGIPAFLLTKNVWQPQFHFARSALSTVAGSSVLIGLSLATVLDRLPLQIRDVVMTLGKEKLNRRDFDKLERGYYENLQDFDRHNPELAEIQRTRPKDWTEGMGSEQFIRLERPPYFELRPGFVGKDRGATVRINSWGLRDKEYSRERPPGTQRIAMVGSSFVMGVGVENAETFEGLLEDRLNREAKSSQRYEVLNFGVAGYTQMQHIGITENKVFDYSPSIYVYIEHGDAFRPTMLGLVNYVRDGKFEQFDFLREIAARADVAGSTDSVAIMDKLKPFQEEILLGVYRRLVAKCRAHHVPAVWVYVPRPEEHDRGPTDVEVRLAREAGFEVLVLDNVYKGQDLRQLWLARWDHHPNAAGHAMIADRFFEVLSESHWLDPTAGP